MATQGLTTVDFGTGADSKVVTVTGQAGITTANMVEAWVAPIATTTNTADDSAYDDIECIAYNIVNGAGFDILVRTNTGLLHGQHQIGWVWN